MSATPFPYHAPTYGRDADGAFFVSTPEAPEPSLAFAEIPEIHGQTYSLGDRLEIEGTPCAIVSRRFGYCEGYHRPLWIAKAVPISRAC